MRRLRSWLLPTALIAVFGLSLEAVPAWAGPLIAPTAQNRSLSGFASAQDGSSGPDSDSDSAQATDFGPFMPALSADVILDGAVASGGGEQDSRILADSIVATGSMFAQGDTFEYGALAEGSSVNRMEVTFQLNATADYTLQGVLQAFDAGRTELELVGPGGVIHAVLIQGTATTQPVNESGTLPVGSYTLRVLSEASTFGFDFSPEYASGEFDVTLHFMPVGAGGPGGEVPDGDDVTGGPPLRLERLPGGDVRLTWSSSCRPADDDYAVYEGLLGDPTSLTPVACTTSGGLQLELTPGHDAAFYLVVPTNGSTEGSYGDASDGAERRPATSACATQLLAAPICP